MSKKILTAILTAALCLAFAGTAFASDGWDEPIQGKDGLYVTYNAQGKWESTLDASWDDALQNIQPGDTVVFKVALNNEYDGDTYWYMENEVLQTLEENKIASNGAYTYKLTYTNPGGQTSDVENKVVGGSEQDGLKDATSEIDEPVFLDTLKKGDSGLVTLEVKLDGESQGNAYQSTQARLQLLFGVEQVATTPSTPKTPSKSPSTGDTNNSLPYMITMVAAGVVILVIAIVLASGRKRSRKAGE